MKPEFLKDLEKLLGPVRAHKFLDDHFIHCGGSEILDHRISGFRTHQSELECHIRNKFRHEVAGCLEPAEEVKKGPMQNVYRWKLYIPKEYVRDGENNDKQTV